MKESDPRCRSIISVTISPKFIGDWDMLQRALNVLTQQDQSIRTATEGTERRVIIGGASELQLEAICDRLLHEFKIPLDVRKPEIVYLETMRKSSEAEGKYIRQVGGRGQYACAKQQRKGHYCSAKATHSRIVARSATSQVDVRRIHL